MQNPEFGVGSVLFNLQHENNTIYDLKLKNVVFENIYSK